ATGETTRIISSWCLALGDRRGLAAERKDETIMQLKPAIRVACLTRTTAAAAQRSDETLTPNFDHAIPNISHRFPEVVTVDYSTGGASPAHSHAKSAFIYGYVVSAQSKHRLRANRATLFRPIRASLRCRGTSCHQPQPKRYRARESARDGP